MFLIAICARQTGVKGLFDSQNFRTVEGAETVIDRVGQGPKLVPAAGLGFNWSMQHIKFCISRRSVANEEKTSD